MNTNEFNAIIFEYQNQKYFSNDTIAIVKQLKDHRDIEIMAFIASWVSLGDRTQIYNKSKDIYDSMSGKPYEYLMNNEQEWAVYRNIEGSFYRMLKKHDYYCLLSELKQIYQSFPSLKHAIKKQADYLGCSYLEAIISLFGHIGGIPKDTKSACKRLNLFLRWMVRKDNKVDLGIWSDSFDQSKLLIPLDTHVAKNAREMGLLLRKSDNMKAVIELTEKCREIFPNDPCVMDYVLFAKDMPKIETKEDIKEDKLSVQLISVNKQKESKFSLPIRNSKVAPLVQFKDKMQLRLEAYNRMMDNHPDALCHATFSELFSIEVFRMAMLRIKDYLQNDGIYKQNVKAKYNKSILSFDKYISKVYEKCYENDQDLVRSLITDLEIDITKMFYSIKNYLDKYKEKNSASLAIVMTCFGLNKLSCAMHEARELELKKIEPNIAFMDFMKPIITLNPLDELSKEIIKLNLDNTIIDLNKDFNINLAMSVINNKVNSRDRVNEIINNIYKHRQ